MYALLVMMLSVASCRETIVPDPEPVSDDEPSLVVNGRIEFEWNDLTCQESYNAGSGEYRIGTDNMSDYFILSLDSSFEPGSEETVASLIWTTDTDIKRYGPASFQVLDVGRKGIIRLKSPDNKFYVTVRELD